MKNWKKSFLCVLCAGLCGILSGCQFVASNVDSLLSPPKPTGDLYPIQRALEQSVSGEITLKYPTEGDYRSAFILEPLTESGAVDAIAFYSTTLDKAVTMHINLIRYIDEKWVSVGDASIVASGVEKVLFSDLDGDGTKEILVGWNIFGTVDKQLSVYSYKDGALQPRLQEKYTEFLSCDLNEDQRDEVFLATLNTSDKTASAKLYTFTGTGVSELGNCQMDGGVTSYNTPIVSRLSTGRTAVFLDAFKGTGMLTEIIYFENNQLKDPIYNPETRESGRTYRPSTVSCTDIDANNIMELPMLEPLAGMEQYSEADRVYVTKWCAFNGKDLLVVRSAIMNYLDGYALNLPDRWKGVITMTRRTEDRLRIISLWDAEQSAVGAELVRIQVVSENDWDSPTYDRKAFFEITRGDGIVYVAAISSYTGSERITADELKKCFERIG